MPIFFFLSMFRVCLLSKGYFYFFGCFSQSSTFIFWNMWLGRTTVPAMLCKITHVKTDWHELPQRGWGPFGCVTTHMWKFVLFQYSNPSDSHNWVMSIQMKNILPDHDWWAGHDPNQLICKYSNINPLSAVVNQCPLSVLFIFLNPALSTRKSVLQFDLSLFLSIFNVICALVLYSFI